MAKKGATQEIQKLTQKNMAFSLIKNVNDEAIPGFINLQNVNPGAIAKSLIQRAGIRQNGIPGQTNNGVVGSLSMSGQPASTALYGNGLLPQVDYTLSSPHNLVQTIFYAFSFQCKTNFSPAILTLNAGLILPFAMPPTATLKCSIYTGASDYTLNQPMGAKIADAITPISIAGLASNLQVLQFHFNAGISFVSKHSYIILLEVINAAGVLNNMQFQSFNNTNMGVGLIYTTTPSGAYVQESAIPACPWFAFDFNVTAATPMTNIKHAQASNLDASQSYYISGVEDNIAAANGSILNQVGFLNLNSTKMIDPTIINNIPGLLNLNTGNGIINPLLFNQGYIGTRYGFKYTGSFHNYFIALGSQLSGKVPVRQNATTPADKVIDNANGMICKRYTQPNGTDTVIPVTGTVTAPVVSYNIVFAGFLENGVAVPIVAANGGLISGQYEYAIEWIDAQGFIYNPGSYDPAENNYIFKTIGGYGNSAYVNYDTTSINSYVQNNQNTRFMVDITANNPQVNNAHAGQSGPVGACTYQLQFTIPFPTTPANNINSGWACNIYRRTLTQVNDSLKYVSGVVNYALQSEIGAGFIKVATVPIIQTGQSYFTFNDSFTTPPLTTTFDDDLYIPRPADMDEFKSHIIAVGDAIYTNYIFPSQNDEPDFHISDAFQVAFPAGDTYFNACYTLNDSFYAFSNHGTWQISFVGGQTPFILKQISNKLGCISTSKGIVRIGTKLLIPTIEGLKAFDGANYYNAEGALNYVWNNIDTNQTMINLGGNPAVMVGHVPAYDITGAYDPSTKQVVYKIPAVNNDPPTIYVLDVASMIKSTFSNPYMPQPDGAWQTFDNALNLIDVFDDPFLNGVGATDGTYLYIYDKTQGYDAPLSTGSVSNGSITSIMESSDIDFSEKTMIKSFRIWGHGNVTLTFSLDRETGSQKILSNIQLDTYGAKGLMANLNQVCNYFRWSLDTTDQNFEFRGIEIVYANSGVKEFDTVA